MTTLNNVLKFIELKDISFRKFEAECGLSNGTLTGNKRNNVELSADNINKIVERYSTELKDAGYHIIDLSLVGGGMLILNTYEKNNLANSIGASFGKSSNEYDSKIEIKTAAGKTIQLMPEGATEIALLNAFLEERERLITVIDKQSEARIDDLKQNSDRLYTLLNSGLNDLSKVQKAIFAMVRTGLEYEAAIASQGDKKREVELLNSLTKLNRKNLEVDAVTEKGVVLNK